MFALLIAPILVSISPFAAPAGEPPATLTAPPPAAPAAAPAASQPQTKAREPFKQPIPAAAYSIELRPVPGNADGSIKPFYMSATEITWDAFDTYIYRLDEEAGKPPAAAGSAAVTRPSKPYLPPDRGFGHEGYPAITMSFQNAQAFCVWLSAHSGKKYRLPTEQEWEHAAREGAAAPKDAKPDAGPAATALTDTAWIESNSNASTHPVAKKKANALGLYDMLGNVREWCIGPDGKGVARGGAYIDPADKVTVTAREPSNPKWNASDPQIPKSAWWLADGPFIGFRIVCEDDAPAKPDPKSK